MASQPGKQTSSIHIVPFNSRSKENQTIKFDFFNLIRFETFF